MRNPFKRRPFDVSPGFLTKGLEPPNAPIDGSTTGVPDDARCKCGNLATWFYSPILGRGVTPDACTFDDTSDLAPYCAVHGPNTPAFRVGVDPYPRTATEAFVTTDEPKQREHAERHESLASKIENGQAIVLGIDPGGRPGTLIVAEVVDDHPVNPRVVREEQVAMAVSPERNQTDDANAPDVPPKGTRVFLKNQEPTGIGEMFGRWGTVTSARCVPSHPAPWLAKIAMDGDPTGGDRFIVDAKMVMNGWVELHVPTFGIDVAGDAARRPLQRMASMPSAGLCGAPGPLGGNCSREHGHEGCCHTDLPDEIKKQDGIVIAEFHHHNPNEPCNDKCLVGHPSEEGEGAFPSVAEIAASLQGGIGENPDLLGLPVLYETDRRGGRAYACAATVTCVRAQHPDLPGLHAALEGVEGMSADDLTKELFDRGVRRIPADHGEHRIGYLVGDNPVPVPEPGTLHLVVLTPGGPPYTEWSVPYDPAGGARTWRFLANTNPF